MNSAGGYFLYRALQGHFGESVLWIILAVVIVLIFLVPVFWESENRGEVSWVARCFYGSMLILVAFGAYHAHQLWTEGNKKRMENDAMRLFLKDPPRSFPPPQLEPK